MRAGQAVLVPGQANGVVTSGTFSPTLGKSIALARIPVGVVDTVMVDIRGKPHQASVTKPRFVKHGKIL